MQFHKILKYVQEIQKCFSDL